MSNKIEVVDLRSGRGYLEAVKAFENFPSIVSYQSYLDNKTQGFAEEPMEEAVNLMCEYAPWLFSAIFKSILSSLEKSNGIH